MTKHQSGCCCPQEGASFLPVFPHMALPEAQVWDPETEIKSTTLTAWEKQGAGPTLDLPIHTCAPPLLVPLESPSPTQHRTWPFSEDCGNIGKRHCSASPVASTPSLLCDEDDGGHWGAGRLWDAEHTCLFPSAWDVLPARPPNTSVDVLTDITIQGPEERVDLMAGSPGPPRAEAGGSVSPLVPSH